MQWYLASLLMLLVLVGVGLLTGSLILGWLPWRMRPGARVFLGVPLGWSVLTLVITLLGWIGPGYAACHCALVTAALAAAGAWTGRTALRREGGNCLRLAAFCVVASWPVLAPLLRIGCFSLYNDTLLYICQAQWLQRHPFMAAAHTDGGHPAWVAVVVFQQTHLRMGAAFLLGWTQAVFGSDQALDVYPAVAALGLVCGALSIGAMLLAACPGYWLEAWLAALAVAVTVNGFGFGAANGFLPQTWGLALFSTAFGLRSLESSTEAESSRSVPWRTGVPLGLCVSAAMHCYWDLLPLAGPALAATYLLPWPGRNLRAWKRVWRQVRPLLCTVLLLVNLEWGRAFQGILNNVHAVVANPVDWPPWAFPAHALGLKASVWEQGRWIARSAPVSVLLAGCLAVGGWLAILAATQSKAGWRRWQRRQRSWKPLEGRPLVPAFIWLALTMLLFIYFRYAVASPWQGRSAGIYPDGVGQSWSQYKLTIWSSGLLIGLVATLGTGLAIRAHFRWGREMLIVLFVIWCGTGLGWNFFLAGRRGRPLLIDAGTRQDPLVACRAMVQSAAALPADDWIYLDWPTDAAEDPYRELMVYFLRDRSLASHWLEGSLPAGSVFPGEGPRALADCQWVIRYRPLGSSGDRSIGAMGGMTLEKVEEKLPINGF